MIQRWVSTWGSCSAWPGLPRRRGDRRGRGKAPAWTCASWGLSGAGTSALHLGPVSHPSLPLWWESLCRGWAWLGARAGSPEPQLFPRDPLTGLLSLTGPSAHDDGCLPFPDAQKKTPTTVLGSPHTLKSLSPHHLATQGRSWRERRKVRCPCPRGLRVPWARAGWGLEVGRPAEGKPLLTPEVVYKGHRETCRGETMWAGHGDSDLQARHAFDGRASSVTGGGWG